MDLYTYATRQWRRLTSYETYESYSSPWRYAPMTARFPRELEWAVNNAKGYVFAPRRQLTFPPGPGRLLSVLGTTDERVAHIFAPMQFPDGYTTVRWDIGHQRVAGSGAEKTTWKLYTSWSLYTGPDVFDAGYLSPWYGEDELETTEDTHGWEGSRALQVVRDDQELVWFVLTATNSTVNAQSQLTGLSLVGRV
jgi:hypothetical protein